MATKWKKYYDCLRPPPTSQILQRARIRQAQAGAGHEKSIGANMEYHGMGRKQGRSERNVIL